MGKRIPLVEMIKRAENVHGKGRYDYSLITEENYKGTHANVDIKCNVCEKVFLQRLDNHINLKQGCPNCAKNKKGTTESFIEKARKIHGDKYDYSLVDYKNNRTNVIIKCNTCENIFSQTPHEHLSGCGCYNCAIKRVHLKQTLTTEEFIEKARKIHGDKYDYSKVNYLGAYTNILIKCKTCEDTFSQSPHDHLSGCGCPKCGIERARQKRVFTKEEFIEKAREIHGNDFDYSKVDYVNNHTKVIIICNSCHKEFSQIPDKHLNGHQGCPYCSKSHGEKEITKLLELKDIEFIPQYRFNDCRDTKPLPFDFYPPDYNTCIEYDGVQHFRSVEHFGGSQSLEYTQKHDLIKNEYCKKNNIELLRIKYTENVEDKLSQFLSDKFKIEPQSIFDL